MENTTKGLGQEQQQQLLFMMLIQQHEQIAGMGLGRIPNPVTNKTEMDLQSAKYAIDTLVMLQAFTKGNITPDMNEFLEQTVTRLRIDYARAVSDSKKKPETAGGTGNGGADGAEDKGSASADTGSEHDAAKSGSGQSGKEPDSSGAGSGSSKAGSPDTGKGPDSDSGTESTNPA